MKGLLGSRYLELSEVGPRKVFWGGFQLLRGEGFVWHKRKDDVQAGIVVHGMMELCLHL